MQKNYYFKTLQWQRMTKLTSIFTLSFFLFVGHKITAQTPDITAKNLFGQPYIFPACVVKEVLWEGTNTKSTFFYNDKKQLIKHVETDGNVVTNIEYDARGKINRITGLETIKEMNLVYDNEGKINMVYVKTNAGSDKAGVKYKGDRIIEVEYSNGSITYYFDTKYNLTKAVSQSKDSTIPEVEAIIEVTNVYKNYLLSTGDYRFISLLYGDYIQEGGYTAASIDFYKKYTTTDNSTEASKTDSYNTEVQAANAKNFPTGVLFKFNNSEDNFKINISYDCKQ